LTGLSTLSGGVGPLRLRGRRAANTAASASSVTARERTAIPASTRTALSRFMSESVNQLARHARDVSATFSQRARKEAM
jgi:hypothetical protein